jgi:hypothetical protein
MIRMTKAQLGRVALSILALGAGGCSSAPPMKRTMPMEGVAELPPPKTRQIATYRCSVDLQNGQSDVKIGQRSGKDEEAAWKNLSPRIKQGSRAFEVFVEENEKNAKGSTDWAFVTVLETEAGSGRLLRKIPVYEFWGGYDRQAPRGLMLKDGHLQFFIQFWTAD